MLKAWMKAVGVSGGEHERGSPPHISHWAGWWPPPLKKMSIFKMAERSSLRPIFDFFYMTHMRGVRNRSYANVYALPN